MNEKDRFTQEDKNLLGDEVYENVMKKIWADAYWQITYPTDLDGLIMHALGVRI